MRDKLTGPVKAIELLELPKEIPMANRSEESAAAPFVLSLILTNSFFFLTCSRHYGPRKSKNSCQTDGVISPGKKRGKEKSGMDRAQSQGVSLSEKVLKFLVKASKRRWLIPPLSIRTVVAGAINFVSFQRMGEFKQILNSIVTFLSSFTFSAILSRQDKL